MTRFILPLFFASSFVFTGCTSDESNSSTADWCAKVVAHLNENEAGSKVWDSVEAHGGLENWLDAGLLEFRWLYRMLDKGSNAVINTLQCVDPASMKAVHDLPDSETRFGWDGNTAWIQPADAKFPVPPRFWALTPFYFVGIPFVFADLNAKFADAPDIEFEGTTYQQVKVTYASHAGDAPDDYYILLINPKTKLVAGARYIVTSKLVAPNGPGPEKLITLDGLHQVGPVMIPASHRTFSMQGDTIGDEMRDATVSEIRWRGREEVDFAKPAGAKEL